MKSATPWIAAILFVLPTCAMAAGPIFVPFIPPSVVQDIKDAITGESGNGCITAVQKVGDVITFVPGNTATIVAIAGPSSYCKLPTAPVRATLEYKLTLHTNAGIELPDGFKVADLQQWERLVGIVVHAENSDKGIEVRVGARPIVDNATGEGEAIKTRQYLAKILDDPEQTDVETLDINGLQAHRFTVTGKLKTMFASRKTTQVTILQSDKEFIVINAGTKASDFKENEAAMSGLAFGVKTGDADR